MMLYKKQWDFLKKTIETKRIPSALLFSGQDLSGMKQVAFEFIKLINNWQVVPKVHPDLIIIEQEEEIKIKQIRQLHSELSFKAYLAGWKAVIIDKAHTLNQEAQSAFLKLLEEPKGPTVFILISNFPYFLLPTILSRVEHLKFYSSLPKLTDFQKKIISQLLKIKKGNLATRFQYAKKLAESPQDLKEILETWLRYFRESLLSKSPVPQTVKTIKTLQTINFLLSTTNINKRLALEILMLEL